jgi:glycosyltransferase 2 family protein
LALSVALTALTLYFVFRGVDGQVLQRLLARQDRALLMGAGALILVQIGFGAERWRAILAALARGQPPRRLSVQAVFYASIFFNCLPVGTVGGDVARVWLARRFALSLRQLVLSVLIDRMLVVVALIVLAVVTLPEIPHPLAVPAWFGSVAILLVAAGGLSLLHPIERLLGKRRDLWLVPSVLRLAEELRYLTGRGGLVGLFYALMSATCGAMAAYCVARSLDIEIGPIPLIAVMSVVTFVAALPISLAGWGVREVSFVSLLGLLAIDRAAALILSVEFGIITTLVSLPGGLIWLTMRQPGAGGRKTATDDRIERRPDSISGEKDAARSR